MPDGRKPTVIPLNLKVWDFTLTDRTHLRTLTWLGEGAIRGSCDNQRTPQGNTKQEEAVRAYEDFLLEHRLGPGGDAAAQASKDREGYDFKGIEAKLERLIGKGMNCFVMGTAPDLQREKKTEYTPEFIKDFTEKIKACSDHLRRKGWADKAYVYVYDEAPRSAWPEVKKIDTAIKSACPEARIIQCLNEPEDLAECQTSGGHCSSAQVSRIGTFQDLRTITISGSQMTLGGGWTGGVWVRISIGNAARPSCPPVRNRG